MKEIRKLVDGERDTMHWLWSWRKATCLMILAVLIAAPVFGQESVTQYMEGKFAGEKDAQSNPLWFVAGLGCGPFGVAGAYLMKPSPSGGSMVGKSSDYVLGYTDGYRSKSASKNGVMAWAGWGSWILLYLALGS